MKKLLTILLVLFSFTAMAQPCADEDTVRSNAVTLITATTVRVNGSISHFAIGYTTLYMMYVRVGQTDTATASGVSPLRNLTGLQPNTQYYYYYKTICLSGTYRQLGPYYFTTAVNTIVYATERSTVFPYIKTDSGLKAPRGDTSLYRAPNTTGSDIMFKTSDSTMYYYNGARWTPMAVDSAGMLALLNNKVDSVTVDSVTNRLYYWKQGVSYGYALPLDSASVTSVATNNGTGITGGTITTTGTLAIDTVNVISTKWYRQKAVDSLLTLIGAKPSGSGTTDYLARWTNSTTLGIGATRDDGSSVGIGTAPSGVAGSISIASRLYIPYYAGSTGGIYVNGLKWGKADVNGNNVIGFNSGSDSATATGNAILGNGTGGRVNGFGNVLLGDEVAPTMTGYDGSFAGSRNIFIGYQAGKFAVKPSHNISIGTGSGQNADSALSNIWIGKGTGAGTRNSVGDVFLGSSINYTGTYNSIGFNSVVGSDAFQAPTTARYNSILGAYAGQGLTTGRENVLGGYNAGASFTDGSQNVSLGAYAAYLQSGSLNVHIGYLADAYNATAYNRKLFINTKGDGGDVALIGGDGNSGQVAINKTIAQIAADAANFQVHGTSHLDSTLIVDWKIGIRNSAPDSTVDITGSLRATTGVRFSGLATGPAAKRVMADANGTLYLSDSLATSGGGGGTPGGSNTEIQFNNSGAFGGSANFTWNGSRMSTIAATIGSTSTPDATSPLTIDAASTNTAYLLQMGKDGNPAYFRIDKDGNITDIGGGAAPISSSGGKPYFTSGFASTSWASNSDGNAVLSTLGSSTVPWILNTSASTTDNMVSFRVMGNNATTKGDIQQWTDNSSNILSVVNKDGKFGAGVSSPTAFMHLKAGTATANTAPIKLNTGTALTTPEDGAIEYHGSHIYFTIGSTRYQLDQQAGTNLGNSDLTQTGGNRSYSGGNQNLSFNGGGAGTEFNVEYGKIILTGLNSGITIQGDSIILYAESHLIHVDSLLQSVAPTNKMVVWDSVGKKLYSQAIPTGGGLSASNFVFNEVPSGTINGINTTFTLANTPTAGTVRVFLRGLRMKLTTDYTISGSTITMINIPGTGDDLITDYLK